MNVLIVFILAILVILGSCRLTKFYSQPENRYYYSYHPYNRGGRSIDLENDRDSMITFQGGIFHNFKNQFFYLTIIIGCF